jgi:hypothetical protein
VTAGRIAALSAFVIAAGGLALAVGVLVRRSKQVGQTWEGGEVRRHRFPSSPTSLDLLSEHGKPRPVSGYGPLPPLRGDTDLAAWPVNPRPVRSEPAVEPPAGRAQVVAEPGREWRPKHRHDAGGATEAIDPRDVPTIDRSR